MTDLDTLIAAVERGDDDEVASILRDMSKDARNAGGYWPSHDALKAYRGSLDAAQALHDAILPGWFPGVSQNIHHGHWYAWVQDKASVHFSAVEPCPARAWLLAVLKAMRVKGETE